MDEEQISKIIKLRLADGKEIEATLTYSEEDETSSLKLVAEGVNETSTNSDFFESFSDIRKKLAMKNILPLCYAASRNVWPSGMARSMGQGLKAYKLKMGIQAKMADLIEIFETGSDIDPVTPEEQKAFADEWIKSLGKK